MASVNKVILIGNLGKDPELKAFSNGNQSVKTSLATTESWTDKATGEKKEKTEWHIIVVFNKNIGDVLMKYAKKGSRLYVEGRIESRIYTDKEGIQKTITEIVIPQFGGGQIVLLDSKKEGHVPPSTGSAPQDDFY